MGHIPAGHVIRLPCHSPRHWITRRLAALFACTLGVTPHALGAQLYPSITDRRLEGHATVGVASLAAGDGAKSHAVAGAAGAWTAGTGPWYFGTSSRLWVSSKDNGVSGYSLSFALRAVHAFDAPGLELHGDAGLGYAGVDVDQPSTFVGGGSVGGVLELGISREWRFQADLGGVLSADVILPPYASRDPRVRPPVLMIGFGVRHHGFASNAMPGEPPTRRWPWPARPRPPIVNP